MEIDGQAEGENLRKLSVLPDLDGDGYADILIGAQQAYAVAGLVRVVSSQTGATIYEDIGEFPGEGGLGHSIASLGDFNGDSVPDYAAGGSGAIPDVGYVLVYSGRNGEEIAEIVGPPIPNYRLGETLTGPGDLNGDGFTDIVAGGFEEVRVFAGPDGCLLRVHRGPFTRPSVAAVGDMDHDGHPDYAIGWPQDGTMGCTTGKITVHSGTDGSVIHEVYGFTPCGGGANGDYLGRSVAAAGDVNQDGYPDFIGGATFGIGDQFGVTNFGYARVYSGKDASILHHVTAENSAHQDAFGYSAAGGADVSGDGVPDFAVGAPADDTDFIPSVGLGSVTVFCGATGQMLWKIRGPGFPNEYGNNVAILSDLDGDGLSEFGFAEHRANFSFDEAGRITILRGAPGGVVPYCTSEANSTGSPATLDLLGPISVGNDELEFQVIGVPGTQFGLFVYATRPSDTPFGDGNLCLGGELFRVGDPAISGATGELVVELPFDAPPANTGSGQIEPGSTWYVQCWYRDPGVPGGSGFNLSDAFAISFTL